MWFYFLCMCLSKTRNMPCVTVLLFLFQVVCLPFELLCLKFVISGLFIAQFVKCALLIVCWRPYGYSYFLQYQSVFCGQLSYYKSCLSYYYNKSHNIFLLHAGCTSKPLHWNCIDAFICYFFVNESKLIKNNFEK